MKRTTLTILAAAIGLAFATGAVAGSNMSKASYQDSKTTIEADYKTAKAGCDPLQNNAKDVCKAQAKGKESVALAELEAAYRPSSKNRYDARIAVAKAEYSVAVEKCDDKSGNDKDVCVKEAKAAQTAAKANAKVQLKTVDANRAAQVKTTKAQANASTKITAVRQSAAADKRDASYAVAKEKCDTLSGDAKAACMSEAKSQYGKL
ncbi:MAG: hypothetical protein H7Y14_02125 [Burkholderiales bacterium]|nr:hypothetical protein [Burkholderiales bacterium]